MKSNVLSAVKSILTFIFAFNAALELQAQTTHRVTVSDFDFSPATLQIEVGDTVLWNNNQGSHNVNGNQATFPGNPASFGNDVGTGWTYSFVFTEAGTYEYQCDPHASMGMEGQVVVNAPAEEAEITLSLSSMDPHIGQMMVVYLIDNADDEILETVVIDEIAQATFDLDPFTATTGGSYRIDFYADHNGNETYDAPTTDHAWRIQIENLEGDTVVPFIHNTQFTDIFETPTGVNDKSLVRVELYPNPAGDFVSVSGDDLPAGELDLTIINLSGQVMRSFKAINNGRLTVNLNGLSKGAYYLLIESAGFRANAKFVKM